jgi:hypothetical protein
MRYIVPHVGHFAFLPAAVTGSRIFALHALQRTVTYVPGD